MKKRLEIELFDEHEIVNIYTVQFENESSEIDKFLDKFPLQGKYARSIQTIIRYLDQIGKRRFLKDISDQKENMEIMYGLCQLRIVI